MTSGKLASGMLQVQNHSSVKLRVNNHLSQQREVKHVRITVPNENQPYHSQQHVEKQQQQPQTHNEQATQTGKKQFRICIFDYEKKAFLYKVYLQIKPEQVISEIFLFFMSEKMVGYVINDDEEERGKVYYSRIRVNEEQVQTQGEKISMFSSRKLLTKKKNQSSLKRCNRFNFINSIMQVPLLKYNGETDTYLFKDLNTVYSLQVYQLEHEIVITTKNNKNTSMKDKFKIKPKPIKNQYTIDQEQQHPQKLRKNSLDIMNEFDFNQLEKEINQIANKMRLSMQKEEDQIYRQKYSVKIAQEIEILTEENIVDIALSEVYLVVVSNEFIRFYSIFNLNTLLFKCEINNAKQLPPPSIVELNKSYVMLTHENSTLISSYTILERSLKYNSTCEMEIGHCQCVLKLFMNSYNCEVAILARQFQTQGRMANILRSKRSIALPHTNYKKSFVDISLAYINFSSTRCETQQLYLKQQKFKNLLICKWSPEYILQTENEIIAKQWRQSFENMRCSCIHPTGQYLIIGLTDCFKIYAVTQEGLQNTYLTDVVKDCQSITYSKYGDQFAIGGANTISIYGSYDCSKKYTIILSVGSIVQNLEYRGPYLICTLRSKKIIVYQSLLHYKQTFSFNPKQYLTENKHEINKKPGQSAQNLMTLTIKRLVSIEIYSLFYDLELNVLIFSSGQKIFFINTLTNQSIGNYQFQPISTMEYNKQLATLFIGTFAGELVAFPWPNKPSNIMTPLPRFKFHSSKIIKIKITSDFKSLVTLGNDRSIYKSNINYILNLKRLKGSDIVQYKSNRSGPTYCNFLNSKGICQFSHSQNIEKIQVMKQLQQEAVNTVFMLPEERMRQKENLLQKLAQTKDQLNSQNVKQYEPLHEESAGLRNKIHYTKEQIINTKRRRKLSLEKQRKKHEQQTRDLLNKYSQMNYQNRLLTVQFSDELQELKAKNKQQYDLLIKENDQKQKEIIKEIQDEQLRNENEKNNFFQIDLIDQEKQAYLRKQLEYFQVQIDQITSQNGQLSCKNSTVQKQIHILKYRIQELKFVSMNAKYSIEQLLGKEKKQQEEKLFFQNLSLESAKVNVSLMEKKYIKATKELIEKNKLIDLNLALYEKEKQVLVTLQKTVEKTESEISRIVDSLQQEKDFRKYLIEKCISTKERVKQLFDQKHNKKVMTNKWKSNLRSFLNKLHDLEEELQDCLHENIRKKTKRTDEVMLKLQELEQFGNKQQPNKGNKYDISLSKVSKKSQTQSNQRLKSQMAEEQQRGKESRRESKMMEIKMDSKVENIYTQIMSNLRKSSGVLMKQKKSKKIRGSTEQKQRINTLSKDDLAKKMINEESTKRQVRDSNNKISQRVESNRKQTFKIEHKSKFLQQFEQYRKDRLLLNNIVTGKFWQSTERQEDQPAAVKAMQKTSSRFYNMRTEDNNGTERFSININNSNNNNNNRNSQATTVNNNNNDSSRFFLTTNSHISKTSSTIIPPPTPNNPPPHHQNPMTSHQNQLRIQKQKHNIIKKLATEDKLVNQINNDKRIFMTRKNRLNQQNQDLLNSYNHLIHENKYYHNLNKAYQDAIKEQPEFYRLNPPHTQQSPRQFYSVINESLTQPTKSTSKLNQTISSRLYNNSSSRDQTVETSNPSKMTPFEQYLKNKEIKDHRLMKKNVKYTQQSLKTQQTEGQSVPALSKVKKPQTQQQKRMKTVPCVQFDF